MTFEEQNQFIRDNWQDMTDKEIGSVLNRSTYTIMNRRAKMGLYKKKNLLSEKQKKDILKLISLHDVKYLSEKYDVPKYIIYNVLNRSNIKPTESKTYDTIAYKFKKMGYDSIAEAREKLGNKKWKESIKQFKNK